jgi:corticotropin releasing hormone receptor 1
LQVLITKLRATNNAETQQYRKATKALLVLIPLLGITYILVITGPAEGVSATIYDYVTAVLLSTQVMFLIILRLKALLLDFSLCCLMHKLRCFS